MDSDWIVPLIFERTFFTTPGVALGHSKNRPEKALKVNEACYNILRRTRKKKSITKRTNLP